MNIHLLPKVKIFYKKGYLYSYYRTKIYASIDDGALFLYITVI